MIAEAKNWILQEWDDEEHYELFKSPGEDE